MTLPSANDPHANQPILHSGASLQLAHVALVLIHGRGSSARDILSLAPEVAGEGVAAIAPQAAGGTWYPHRFIAPLNANEPFLSSALATVGRIVEAAAASGIPRERIVLLGFSQGACLALEYAARNPARYGGVIGFSGGLIGPEGIPIAHSGDLAETPVFLGVADRDAHIPQDRVQETADVFRGMNAAVTHRVYPGIGHTVVADELAFVSDLLASLMPA